jgi:hypothetical protein
LKATDRKLFKTQIFAGIILTLLFYSAASAVGAQNVAGTFTSTDKFSIPQQNGSISFITNGSYTSVTLQNDSWVFTDLALNSSSPLGNLTVSAKNSQITIYTFFSSQAFSQFGRTSLVRFWVQGQGEQVFNLGLNLTRSTHQSEWSVIVPANADGSGAVFLAEGKDWHLRSDNTVVIDGVVGNVTIAYFGSRFNAQNDRNLPFVQQHSVAIATIFVVVVTVAVATLISYRTRRKN